MFLPTAGVQEEGGNKVPFAIWKRLSLTALLPDKLTSSPAILFLPFPRTTSAASVSVLFVGRSANNGKFWFVHGEDVPKGNISWTEAQHCSSLQPDAGKTTFSTQIIRVHGSEVNKVCKMEVGYKRLMRCVKTKGNDPWLMSVCQHTIKCPELLC